VLLFAPAAIAEFQRGQALYENHCRFCHESWTHEQVGSRITSIHALRQRVEAWSIHSGLGWGNKEIDDVTDYLNRHFYTFNLKP
jgi:mono/diheme cytochrome c family protein